MPPALVASTPPIWQLPSEARLNGNSRPRIGRDLLCLREHQSRLDRHGVRGQIDVAHAVEPLQRDHDLMARLERDLSADQPGIAALRHDLRPGLVGKFQDRRDFFRAAGLQHERRLAAIAVAPFDEIASHFRLVANGVRWPTMRTSASSVSWLGGAVLVFACHG